MRLIAILLASLLASGATVWAQEASAPEAFDAIPADAGQPFGGMAISPTRLVMDGARGGQVMIYNSSSATVSYRIEALDIAIDEQGQHMPVAEGAVPPWSALPYLRYAPRQVTLGPGQRQAIKVIARPPGGLPPGELRSHLRFSSIPVVAPVDEAPAPTDEKGDRTVSVTVGMDFRVTIPVLLRTGTTMGGAAIAKLVLPPAGGAAGAERMAAVTIARTGNRSDYGTIRLIDAKGETVGLLRGASVPAPLAQRVFPVALTGTTKPARAVYIEELPGMRDGATIAERAID